MKHRYDEEDQPRFPAEARREERDSARQEAALAEMHRRRSVEAAPPRSDPELPDAARREQREARRHERAMHRHERRANQIERDRLQTEKARTVEARSRGAMTAFRVLVPVGFVAAVAIVVGATVAIGPVGFLPLGPALAALALAVTVNAVVLWGLALNLRGSDRRTERIATVVAHREMERVRQPSQADLADQQRRFQRSEETRELAAVEETALRRQTPARSPEPRVQRVEYLSLHGISDPVRASVNEEFDPTRPADLTLRPSVGRESRHPHHRAAGNLARETDIGAPANRSQPGAPDQRIEPASGSGDPPQQRDPERTEDTDEARPASSEGVGRGTHVRPDRTGGEAPHLHRLRRESAPEVEQQTAHHDAMESAPLDVQRRQMGGVPHHGPGMYGHRETEPSDVSRRPGERAGEADSDPAYRPTPTPGGKAERTHEPVETRGKGEEPPAGEPRPDKAGRHTSDDPKTTAADRDQTPTRRPKRRNRGEY